MGHVHRSTLSEGLKEVAELIIVSIGGALLMMFIVFGVYELLDSAIARIKQAVNFG